MKAASAFIYVIFAFLKDENIFEKLQTRTL